MLVPLSPPSPPITTSSPFTSLDFTFKVLLKNRAKVLYCTRLNQAQDADERKLIEEEMLGDEASKGPAILEALKQQATAESWEQDRMADFQNKTRREAAQLKGMHTEGAAAAAAAGGGGGGAAAGGGGGADVGAAFVRAPAVKAGARSDVDLEALAFEEGGHLMSNQRCELPEKSWRASKKGYEEVHVPARVSQLVVVGHREKKRGCRP
jgi:pre-mRNA-splicing helicase BRR2